MIADQPLFALAKKMQWTSPATLGADHFVVVLGGLHIELAILKVWYIHVQNIYVISFQLMTDNYFSLLHIASTGRLAEGQWLDKRSSTGRHRKFWDGRFFH